nr:hypothetical protein WG33_0177 [uncultured bacterium]
MTRERSVTPLRRDDGRHAALLEPAKEPTQLGTHNERVGKRGKKRIKGVDENALGANGVDCRAEPQEQAFEIVFSGFLDFAALEMDIVDDEFLLPRQRIEVHAERGDVTRQFMRHFLEGDQDARLAELDCAAQQKLDAEESLAAARGAANQGRPSLRQAAEGNLVKPFYSSGCFGNGLGHRGAPGVGRVFCHEFLPCGGSGSNKCVAGEDRNTAGRTDM